MVKKNVTELRGGSCQIRKDTVPQRCIQSRQDTVYAYDSFGRRILEGDILNRWARHTEYRGLTMDVSNGASKNVTFCLEACAGSSETTPKTRCPKPRNHSGLGLVGISKNRQRRVFRDCPKNAAVHGIKEPRESRGIDSMGMKFTELGDFLPAFADFCRASPYDFTHVALTLPLGMGGEVFGLLQTEHSGINFNPFVNASHTDAERHYFGKDHLGSVRAVTNQWGSPLYMFDYDVFGQPVQDRPERYRHGFTGKEYDSWTGLYNYGFRDYSAMFGRFTSVDPIQDGHNWYAYVNSDPVSWLDPWGLNTCPYAQSGEDTAATNVNTAHWRDNGDGTWTAISEGATLWEVWGADWKEKSGFTRDPRTLQVGETVGIKIPQSCIPSGTPSEITKQIVQDNAIVSYTNSANSNSQGMTFWDKYVGKSTDGLTRALYTSGKFNNDIDNGQLNFSVDFGVAEYGFESRTLSIFDGLVGLKLDGTIGAFTGQGCIGLKDFALGSDCDISMLKFSANLHMYLQGNEYNPKVTFEGYIGGLACGKRLTLPIYEKIANGLGFGVTTTLEKSNEEEY